MTRGLTYLFLAAVFAAALSSCSTTRRLADDQTLYVGVRKMKIESAERQKGAHGEHAAHKKVPGSVRAAVRQPLSVKPNNPLISPWVRTPFPVGLWAYNSLYTEKKKGFRAWLYRTFAKQPVVMERDVQPGARVGMVGDILDNHGYFGSDVAFELFPRHNPKKARAGYTVSVARPWYFATVRFPVAPTPATPATDTLISEIAALKASSNVKPGLQYNIDTLAREQVRITGALRAEGYYWFRPEYLEYQADTTRTDYGIDLRMNLARGIPAAALRPYKTGDLTLRLFSADGLGDADSMDAGGVKVWYQKPLKLRPKVIKRAMSLHTGETASLPAINRMLDNLTRLGVFRYVNLEVTPLDSLSAKTAVSPETAPLDMAVSAAMDTPMEATIEADLSYLSSSFIGPSLVFGLTHNNIFRGGETLSARLDASYEWQTGNTSASANSTAVNSYEIGLTGSLTFPRMVVPGFIGRALKRGGTTSYQLGADLLNRPKFFRMLSMGFTNSYDFRTSSTVSHSFTPFKMVYNKLLHTTPAFDTTMAANPVIALSFADQFIPSGSYTFTFDKRLGHLGRDRMTFQLMLMTAGNIWSAVGARKLFGQPLSQFFKETAELRYFKQLDRNNMLAFRLFAGAGHAYGNSTVLPYAEQFYIGGANSIRAFTIRSLGPGSYHPDAEGRYGYFDQTGDLKLELNAEYRFKIAGGLNGAVFFDAGNIWLQKDDPSRPGGRVGSGAFFEQVATGTGVGLRYDLSFLVVRLDLGVGIHLPYDTGVRGYYNIPRFRDGLGLHLAIGYPF